MLKIGALCYATWQGLGVLAKAFYNNGVITHPYVVRHSSRETHYSWYPSDTPTTSVRPLNTRSIKEWVRELDILFCIETPFDWELIPFCRQVGVKTVLMPMYECEPFQLPHRPDKFLCPSLLDKDYYPNDSVFIPVPVSVPWKQRETANVFIHNAGHGGLRGRNGTRELMQAMKYVKANVELIVRSQGQLDAGAEDEIILDQRVTTQIGTQPYETLWSDGDVFIFPEKFNGLSLPLQEARASGMLVMCGDRYPMNTWLPREPLISVSHYIRDRIGPPYSEYERAEYDAQAIAAKIDEWAGRDVTEYSEQGRVWAESMSWEVLKPRYVKFLEELL